MTTATSGIRHAFGRFAIPGRTRNPPQSRHCPSLAKLADWTRRGDARVRWFLTHERNKLCGTVPSGLLKLEQHEHGTYAVAWFDQRLLPMGKRDVDSASEDYQAVETLFENARSVADSFLTEESPPKS